MGTTIELDAYQCSKCGIIFSKFTTGYHLLRKRAWNSEGDDYFWDFTPLPPVPGELWACSDKDRTIQEII